MPPSIRLQPAKLATYSADRTACLTFVDGVLVAVLVRLDDPGHGKARGSWFLEVGFGPCETANPPVFPTVEAPQRWVLAQCEAALWE
jgi:hypothetical protein